MPFAIRGAFAIVCESDSSIHVIGGENDKCKNQSTHYAIKLVEHYRYIFQNFKKVQTLKDFRPPLYIN